MGNTETKDGRIQPVETRPSRKAFPQQLKEIIQRSINESESSSPIEFEIVGENEKCEEWSIRIPPTVPSLIKALPPRYKEKRDDFFNLVVDPALRNATHMIIRKVSS